MTALNRVVAQAARGCTFAALICFSSTGMAQSLSHFPDVIYRDGAEGVSAGPFYDADAARFLAQSTFGPTDTDIAHLRAVGYQAWLNEQFDPVATPPTLMLDYYNWVTATIATGGLNETPGDQTIREAWLRGALGGPDPQTNATIHSDQLRQRIAFALSEIFVISQQNTMIDQRPDGQAYFYDLLTKDAFGNFRQLLEDVTLSTSMGTYLNMLGNQRAILAANIHPDENYAREINQLFSIGLVLLNDDGTVVLSDASKTCPNGQTTTAVGLQCPNYTQPVVTAFAHVLTGWNFKNWSGGAFWPSYPHLDDNVSPMAAFPAYHDNGTNAVNDLKNKQLLSYTNACPSGVSATICQGTLADGGTPYGDLTFALDNIFNHPSVGPFISKQLIQRLVTSNPSAAYVKRVAQVFNNDGSNIRGNLKAVVRAILLDVEARYGQYWNPATFGKLREPDLRITHLWRAMGASHICAGAGYSNGDYVNPYRYAGYSTGYALGDTIYGSGVGQAALNANTVFNFFRPDYVPAGEMASGPLYGPEFQINTDTLISNSTNSTFGKMQYYYTPDSPSYSCSGLGGPGEVAIDRGQDAALAGSGIGPLLDKYNVRFMSGQMSPFMRQTLQSYLTSIAYGATNPNENRVSTALMLILTSPEYMIQK